MTTENWLTYAEKILYDAEIPSARLDATLLLEHVLHINRETLLIKNPTLTTPQLTSLSKLLEKRSTHYPLCYITNSKEFYDLHFYVDESVLIPRPETESIVDHIVSNHSKDEELTILEIGTGSGCIAITLATIFRSAHITATDVDQNIYKAFNLNQAAHATNVKLIHSDLFNKVSGTFDIIIANLPYVPTTSPSTNREISFEPQHAIFSGPDGLDHYKEFFRDVQKHLKKNGYILVEHEPEQLNKIVSKKSIIKISDYTSKINL